MDEYSADECKKCKRGRPKWLVTYADMVTLLLCFFVLMLAFANTDAVKFKEVLGSVKDAFGVQRDVFELGKEGGMELPITLESSPPKTEMQKQRLVNLLQTAVKEEGLEKNVLIALHRRGVKMEITELAGSAMFEPGGTEILAESRRLLLKLIPIMHDTVYKITVEGHSDNIPVKSPLYPSNWELSSARAGSVVRFLIQTGNLDPRRFSAVGHADTQPLRDNDTPENRARNRRVSIVYEVF
jgi:chemotaxis protein MotB